MQDVVEDAGLVNGEDRCKDQRAGRDGGDVRENHAHPEEGRELQLSVQHRSQRQRAEQLGHSRGDVQAEAVDHRAPEVGIDENLLEVR